MTKASLSPTAAHPIRLRETEESLWSPDLKHLVIVRGAPGEGIVNLGTYRSECEHPELYLEHRLIELQDRLKSARRAMKLTMRAIEMMTNGFIETDTVRRCVNQIRAAQAAEPIIKSGSDIAEMIESCLQNVEELLEMADIEEDVA